jgi:hypothetical protein
MLRDAFILFGSILEIVGVLLMANSYLGAAHRRHWPSVLTSALVRGKRAKGAVRLSGLNEEDQLLALQGLALIGLGFACQAGAVLWPYLMKWIS